MSYYPVKSSDADVNGNMPEVLGNGEKTAKQLLENIAQLHDDVVGLNRRIRRVKSGQVLSSAGAAYDGSSGVTLVNCILIPSSYNAVRITVAHKGGSGAMTGAKMVVAATDDIGDLLNDANEQASKKFVIPYLEGIAKNEVSEEGWHEVTWGGNATFDIADSGDDNLTYATSDVVEISSREIVGDKASKFEGYTPILIRMYAGTDYYTKGGTADTTRASFISEAGPNIVLMCARYGDNVSNLSLMTDTSAVSIGADKVLPCIVEAYRNNSEAISCMTVGDSRLSSASSELVNQEYRNVPFFLKNVATLDNKKLSVLSMAQPGQVSAIYQKRALDYLNTGGYVDVAVYLINTINDGVPTNESINKAKSRVMLFIDECVQRNITPLLITSFPLASGYTEGQLVLLNDIEQFAEDLGFPFISPLKLYGDSVGGWLPTFGTGDSHMTDSGYEALSTELYGHIKVLAC